MAPAFVSLDEAIVEMMNLQRTLPPRPSLEELEAALAKIKQADTALASRLEELSRQRRPDEVFPSMFAALQEMRKEVFEEEAQQLKRNAEASIKIEQRHRRFDNLIQKAHSALTSGVELLSPSSKPADAADNKYRNVESKGNGMPGLDSQTKSFKLEASLTSVLVSTGEAGQKPLITSRPGAAKSDSESVLTRSVSWTSAKYGGFVSAQPKSASPVAGVLSATPGGPLSLQQEIPSPIADENVLTPFEDNTGMQGASKVFSLLDMAVKNGFKSLDLHGVFLKELEWVPESLGQLTWLTELNLSGNRLASLPDSIGELLNLTSLDLSANQLIALPDSIGRLTALVTLSIEKNRIEELPWTIGQCKALVELNADFNKLKALPEAVGNLGNLRSLTVHLNCLRSLPSSMATMTSLAKLDVHFNQLESIPESLCLVTTLTQLNLGSNFTDLKELPQSIGRLQKLKDLDISFNHLTVLPDSFAMLTNLQILSLEGNPLRLPPLHIGQQGKEAVLRYMVDYVAQKEGELRKVKKRGLVAKLISRILGLFKKRNKRVNEDLEIMA